MNFKITAEEETIDEEENEETEDVVVKPKTQSEKKMSFKITSEEETTEDIEKRKKKSEKLMIIILVVISLLSGLTVFLISNALFGKKDEPVEIDNKVDINDSNVQILYSYVSYEDKNQKNEKFIKEQSVTLNSFSNSEKFYYALQFVQPDDLSFTGELTEEKQKIYLLPDKKVKTYMQRYFGPQVTYKADDTITYTFDFKINNKNIGVLNYSDADRGFKIYFTGLEEKNDNADLVQPYYSELVSAERKEDNSLELTEKVIYTEVKEENGIYEVDIYKDYQKKRIIEKKTNLTLDELKKEPISIEKYKATAATVTYLFKVYNNSYYFYSSTISN